MSNVGNQLSGKVALIIGATRGLGLAIAVGYAQEGAEIIALGRNKQVLDALEEELTGLGQSVVCGEFDVLQPNAFPDLVNWLRSTNKRPDVVVYLPGGGLYALAETDQALRERLDAGRGQIPFWEIEEAQLERVLDLGLRGLISCCRHLAPLLIEAGHGSIIAIGSSAGLPGQAAPGADAAYCAEKGAAMCYVLEIARELKPLGVAANILLPGPVLTDLTRFVTFMPAGFFRPVEEIVPAAIFLAQQDGSGVTGEMFSSQQYLKTLGPETPGAHPE